MLFALIVLKLDCLACVTQRDVVPAVCCARIFLLAEDWKQPADRLWRLSVVLLLSLYFPQPPAVSSETWGGCICSIRSERWVSRREGPKRSGCDGERRACPVMKYWWRWLWFCKWVLLIQICGDIGGPPASGVSAVGFKKIKKNKKMRPGVRFLWSDVCTLKEDLWWSGAPASHCDPLLVDRPLSWPPLSHTDWRLNQTRCIQSRPHFIHSFASFPPSTVLIMSSDEILWIPESPSSIMKTDRFPSQKKREKREKPLIIWNLRLRCQCARVALQFCTSTQWIATRPYSHSIFFFFIKSQVLSSFVRCMCGLECMRSLCVMCDGAEGCVNVCPADQTSGVTILDFTLRNGILKNIDIRSDFQFHATTEISVQKCFFLFKEKYGTSFSSFSNNSFHSNSMQ